MLLHLTRSRPLSLMLRRTYRLSARLDVLPEEHDAIRSHGLDRFEVFADPYRDHVLARADAARERVKALPWFSAEPEKDALTSVWQNSRELTLLVRARLCFRITIGDLITGVSITNYSLNDISKIERILHNSVDLIARTVTTALQYQHEHEDLLTPGKPKDETTPPDKWPSSW